MHPTRRVGAAPMTQRDELAYHPAHRSTHDMGAVDPERVEQARRVIGHRLEPIRGSHRQPQGSPCDLLPQGRHPEVIET